MNKSLIFSTRRYNGKESSSLLNHYSFLNSLSSDIDILHSNKTDKSKSIIQDYTGIHVSDMVNLFSNEYDRLKELPCWMDVYNELDVSSMKQYKLLAIMGGPYYPKSNLSRLCNRVGVFPNDRGQLKFQSTAHNLLNFLAMVKAHNEYDIPLHHWAKTPEEFCADCLHDDIRPKNTHLYHGYDIPKYNIKRLDTLPYNYIHSNNTLPIDKVYDFTFGYTVLPNTDRYKYHEHIQNMTKHFENNNIYIRNDKTGENTFLSNDAYFEKIKHSKYTYMLPAYDNHCFSIYRFIESLGMDCLPLIHPDCNIEDVNKSFGVDLSILKTDKPFNNSDYEEIKEYMKSKFLVFEKTFIGV